MYGKAPCREACPNNPVFKDRQRHPSSRGARSEGAIRCACRTRCRDVTTPYYTKYAVWYNTYEYGVFGQIGVFIRFSPHTVIRFEFCASNVITRQYEGSNTTGTLI